MALRDQKSCVNKDEHFSKLFSAVLTLLLQSARVSQSRQRMRCSFHEESSRWIKHRCQSIGEAPKGRAAKLKRSRGLGFLGKGCSPPHQLGSQRERCKRFGTFYRLTKPRLVSILLVLNLFQWNLWAASPRRPPQPNFCGGLDSHKIGAYGPVDDLHWL